MKVKNSIRSCSRGGRAGGGGVLPEKLGGMCDPLLKTLFMTKTAKTVKTAAHTFIAHIRNCPPILVFQTIDSG